MSLEPELLGLMNQTATVSAFAGYSAYGSPSYSTAAIAYPCRIVGKSRLVKDAEGRDVVANTTVYLGPSSSGGMPGLTVQSKLVLSDSTGSAQILSVGRSVDEDGTAYYEVAYCG